MDRKDDELSTYYVWKRGLTELEKAGNLTMKMMGLAINSASSVASAIQNREMIKKIEAKNKDNRNVSDIGSVDPQSLQINPHGNVLITGAVDNISNVFLNDISETVRKENCPLVFLHSGNRVIENLTLSLGGAVINNQNKRYDPFFNRSSYEIYRMLTSINRASIAGVDLKPEALQYISAMHQYIKGVKKRSLTLGAAMTCPHNDLLQRMNLAFSAGIIDQLSFDQMSHNYMVGQSERFSLIALIEELCRNSAGISYDRSRNTVPYNVREAINQSSVISIEVKSPVVLDILASDIEQELINGHKIIVCFDRIYINRNKSILNLLTQRALNSAGGGSVVITEDMLNMCSGDEKMFSDIFATMNTVVLARHPQGKTVEQWSALIGDYEKIERSWGSDTGTMRQKPWELFPGSHKGKNQSFSKTRERILKQEDITSLTEGEFYLFSKSDHKIRKAKVQ